MKALLAVLVAVTFFSVYPGRRLAAQTNTVATYTFQGAPLAGARNARVYFNRFHAAFDSIVGSWRDNDQLKIFIRGYADGTGCRRSLHLTVAECEAFNQSWALQRANLIRDRLVARGIPGNENTIRIEGVVVQERGAAYRKVEVFLLRRTVNVTVIHTTQALPDLSGFAGRLALDSIRFQVGAIQHRLDSLSVRKPRSFLGFTSADIGLGLNLVYQAGLSQKTDVTTPTFSLYLKHRSGITIHFWGGRVPWSRRSAAKSSTLTAIDTVPRADFALGAGIIVPFGRHIAGTFGFQRFGEMATGGNAGIFDRATQLGQGPYVGLVLNIPIAKNVPLNLYLNPNVLCGANRLAFDTRGVYRCGAGLNLGIRTNPKEIGR